MDWLRESWIEYHHGLVKRIMSRGSHQLNSSALSPWPFFLYSRMSSGRDDDNYYQRNQYGFIIGKLTAEAITVTWVKEQ